MTERIDPTQLVSAIPVEKPKVEPMTRSEKLRHWAQLCRQAKHVIELEHSLEFWPIGRLQDPNIISHNSPLGIAAADPVFREQGLANKSATAIMGFFDISQSELHAFSCNCGGMIGREEIAARIEGLDYLSLGQKIRRAFARRFASR